jgi:hypothetical protein
MTPSEHRHFKRHQLIAAVSAGAVVRDIQGNRNLAAQVVADFPIEHAPVDTHSLTQIVTSYLNYQYGPAVGAQRPQWWPEPCQVSDSTSDD